jgi:hypothetical protein
LLQALTDPNFIRLAKGAYSLHCFHPDKEQLVKAPQPKKEAEGEAAGQPGKSKQEDAVPMVRVEAKKPEVRRVLNSCSCCLMPVHAYSSARLYLVPCLQCFVPVVQFFKLVSML